MTSLSTALKIATGSLGNTQAKLSLTAHNLANADTKGYTAKRTSQHALSTAGYGSGAEVHRIQSNVSKFLLEDLLAATSATSAADITVKFLDSLQKSFGAITDKDGKSTSLASTLAKFESALTKLAGTPESASLASAAVRALQDVTDQLQRNEAKVTGQIDQADQQIGDAARDANEAISEIDQLNRQIRQAIAAGQGVEDYEDKVNSALARLSEQMDIKSFRAEDGTVKVYAASGHVLVDRTAHMLSVSKNATGQNEISLGGAEVTDSLKGGKLEALVDLRDVTLPAFKDTLDELAGKLVGKVNSIRPNLLTGSNANDVGVNDAVLKDPKLLLGNTKPAEMANKLLDAMQSPTDFDEAGGLDGDNRTFASYANEILSKAVGETSAAEGRLNVAKTELQTVTNTISSMHGVNINEETARLAELKQLYSVASTVLNAVQEMYKDLQQAVS